MKNTILIAVTFPFMKRDFQRYNVQKWRDAGYNVIILDFTFIAYPSSLGKKQLLPDLLEADYVYKIRNFSDFCEKISSIKGRMVLLQNSVGFSRNFEPYFAYLRQCAAHFVYANPAGFFPDGPSLSGLPWYINTYRFSKKLLSPQKVYTKVKNKLMDLLNIEVGFTHKPDAFVLLCKQERREVEAIIGPIYTPIFSSHTPDFDLFFQEVKKNYSKENYCVFLGGYMNTDHKRQLEGDVSSPINIDKYFQSMRKLFDLVERKTGLEVVIADHPRSTYQNYDNPFGARRVIKHRTPELVLRSKLSILHNSTSFGYNVLSNLPSVFVITSEQCDPEKTPIFSYTSAVARAVGQFVVNIDNDLELERIDFNNIKINEDLYKKYVEEYISLDGMSERSFFDAVHDAVSYCFNEYQ